jgi:Pex19 protein family
MYDPMKQVAVRFPKWLEERRSSLSAQELKKYVPDRNDANDIFSSVAHQPVQLHFFHCEGDSNSAIVSRSLFTLTKYVTELS